MSIQYQRETLDADAFADILRRSGLHTRRPIDYVARLQRMLDGSTLTITARVEEGRLIGIARSLTDWSYACYLSDLAVDSDFQRRGIGRQLIELTRLHAGEGTMCLVVSAPEAVGFYERIGFPRAETAFIRQRSR